MHETRRRRKLSPKASIEDEIALLRDLDLKGLRVRPEKNAEISSHKELTSIFGLSNAMFAQ